MVYLVSILLLILAVPFESTLAEFEPLSNQVATAFAVLCLWHLDSFLHVEGAEHLFLFCVHMHTPVPQFHEQGTQNMSTDLFRDSSWTTWWRRCSISGCCIVDFRLQLMPLHLGKSTSPGNVSKVYRIKCFQILNFQLWFGQTCYPQCWPSFLSMIIWLNLHWDLQRVAQRFPWAALCQFRLSRQQ